MMRTYLDSSVLIHAVKGADGGKALQLLDSKSDSWPERSTGVSHRQFNFQR
jgi:hypothetical protein